MIELLFGSSIVFCELLTVAAEDDDDDGADGSHINFDADNINGRPCMIIVVDFIYALWPCEISSLMFAL